jgi:hypothetical protein
VIKLKIMSWMRHVSREGERRGRPTGCTGFWCGNLRERDHLEERCRWEDNIKMDLQEVRWRALTELI